MTEDSDEILDPSPSHNATVRTKDGMGFSMPGTTERRGSKCSPARSPADSMHGSSSRGSKSKMRQHNLYANDGSEAGDADSEGDSDGSNEFFEFDVFEREGFDKIMQTVACGTNYNSDHGDFAQNICDYFEIFESLTPGRESVG